MRPTSIASACSATRGGGDAQRSRRTGAGRVKRGRRAIVMETRARRRAPRPGPDRTADRGLLVRRGARGRALVGRASPGPEIDGVSPAHAAGGSPASWSVSDQGRRTICGVTSSARAPLTRLRAGSQIPAPAGRGGTCRRFSESPRNPARDARAVSATWQDLKRSPDQSKGRGHGHLTTCSDARTRRSASSSATATARRSGHRRALGRIDDGSYGIRRGATRGDAEAQLQALPSATLREPPGGSDASSR
jgi:hypothetical protein